MDDLKRSSQTALIDKRQDQQAEIAERREEIEGKQNDIQRDAKQWKAWLDDQTQQADEALDKLEKEYVTLDEQAKMLQRSIQSLAIEINLLTQVANRTTYDPVLSPNDAWRELMLRNEQLKYYQTQLNSVIRKADLVSRNAQSTLKKRRDATQRYENETGEFVEQQQKLQRWTKRLQREEKQLKRRPITSPSAELTAAKQHMSMLRSYIDLDWERERNWILSTYKTDAAGQALSK